MIKKNIQEIKEIMSLIAESVLRESKIENATYNDQHTLINNLFVEKGNYNVGTIILRLVVIDSLYSTNASYSYFSIEEMAQRIFELGHSEKEACDYFYKIACGKTDDKKLFNEPYGIQKNLKEGSKQMSLLSKYAYYSVYTKKEYPLGFPIYDRLAKEAYPYICNKLGIVAKKNIDQNIETYVSALNDLRKIIFGNEELFENLQQYDILDAYLWRMGKFSDGNLSLLMSREDYTKFVINTNLQAKAVTKVESGKKVIVYNEKDSDYKKRMAKERNMPTNDFDFNKEVKNIFLATDKNPFKGLSDAEYLIKLQHHWKEFFANKN